MNQLDIKTNLLSKIFEVIKGRKVFLSIITKLSVDTFSIIPKLEWNFCGTKDDLYIEIYESLTKGTIFMTLYVDRVKEILFNEHNNEVCIYFKDDAMLNIVVD